MSTVARDGFAAVASASASPPAAPSALPLRLRLVSVTFVRTSSPMTMPARGPSFFFWSARLSNGLASSPRMPRSFLTGSAKPSMLSSVTGEWATTNSLPIARAPSAPRPLFQRLSAVTRVVLSAPAIAAAPSSPRALSASESDVHARLPRTRASMSSAERGPSPRLSRSTVRVPLVPRSSLTGRAPPSMRSASRGVGATATASASARAPASPKGLALKSRCVRDV